MTQEHSDLIQHLLDGELDAMHEHTLFGQLAVDQDLRTELKQQLAIRNEVQHDRALLLPPAHLSRALFAGIGAAAPIAIANSSGGFWASMLAKIGVPVLAALSAAGITYWATSENQKPNTENQRPVTESQVTKADNNVPKAGEQADDVKTPVSRATTSMTVFEQRIAALERELAAVTEERDALAAWKREQEALPRQDATQLSTTSAYVATPIQLTTTYTPQRNSAMEVYRPVTIGNVYTPTMYPQFMVQLRGFNATSFTDVTVPTQTSFVDNLGLLLMYRLSDRNAFGVEFGSEPIPQSFEGTLSSGQVILYEQQPTTMWAAITYRHTFAPLGLGFSPFAQVGAGGTRYGPTGRATLGIQYEPVGPLTFIFGVEGTSMLYSNESTWYSSNKLGLTYGVALRF
jgi:hypothetical protein